MKVVDKSGSQGSCQINSQGKDKLNFGWDNIRGRAVWFELPEDIQNQARKI